MNKFVEGFGRGLLYGTGLFMGGIVLLTIFVGFHLLYTHVRIVLV